MPPQHLPPELHDCIFSHLRNTSGVPSLRVCLTVSKAFHELVEPHLYYHLTLTNGNDLDRCVEFSPGTILKFFSARPYLAHHVRSLKISLASRSYPYRSAESEDTLLVAAMMLLQDVESICLENRRLKVVSMPRDWLRWTHTSVEFRTTFLQILKLPSMREIRVEDISQFRLHILNGLTSLRTISLSGLFLYQATPNSSASQLSSHDKDSKRAQLKSLTLEDCYLDAVLAWLLDPSSRTSPDISRITHFKINTRSESAFKNLPFLLSGCKSSLEVLEIDVCPDINLFYRTGERESRMTTPTPSSNVLPPSPLLSRLLSFRLTVGVSQPPGPGSAPSSRLKTISVSLPSAFFLSYLSALNHLKFDLNIFSAKVPAANPTSTEDFYTDGYSTPFEWVRRMLEELLLPDGHMNGSNSLERLTLDILFQGDLDVLSKVPWAPLARALSSFSSAVPSLKKVEIRARLYKKDAKSSELDEMKNDGRQVIELLERDEDMGLLIKRGLVSVSDMIL